MIQLANMQKVRRNSFCFVSVLIILTFLLSSCTLQSQPAAGNSAYVPLTVSADNCSYGGEIHSVEAVDQFTVRFTLCSPDAAFPAKMASPIFAVQDSDFLQQHGGDSASMSSEINGTGPYRVLSNNSDGNLELHQSTTYWGLPPATQFLDFSFEKNSSNGATLGEVSSASVTNAFTLTDALKNAMADTATYKSVSHPSLNLVYLGFNNKKAPMDNLQVRQAIASILDRAKLTQSFLSAGAEVADQVVPLDVTPGHSGYVKWYDLNPNDAETLLTSAGYDSNQYLSLAYLNVANDLIQYPNTLALEIQKELAAIHIKVLLKPMGPADFALALSSGTEDMFLSSFKAYYSDGYAYFEYPFTRHSNWFGNPYTSIQQAMAAVQVEKEDSGRQKKFDLLNQEVKNLVPLVPIANVPEWTIYKENVESLAVNGSFVNYENITNRTNSIRILNKNRPASLWPADETDEDTFQITRLLYDTLVSNDFGNLAIKPDLADTWTANSDNTQWTFTLRYGVKFSNGASLDANDVVASFSAIWNTKDANHMGRSGSFEVFKELFGSLLNEE